MQQLLPSPAAVCNHQIVSHIAKHVCFHSTDLPAVADKRVYAEQAEEAAQREAQRLAEEEELREHRKNLQFKVCNGELGLSCSWPLVSSSRK